MLLLCKQFAIIFLIILPSCYALNKFDPYETLEIQRMSTQDEIRQAYRRLVKIWYF